uniref:Ovule protein n=1 Tax=Echinococcus granulosus TaxID=6210 RepID=A0A068WV21_ECHGR|nr:hypothetical protein EgrG_002027700 [Echinococcus granulosus]
MPVLDYDSGLTCSIMLASSTEMPSYSSMQVNPIIVAIVTTLRLMTSGQLTALATSCLSRLQLFKPTSISANLICLIPLHLSSTFTCSSSRVRQLRAV